MTPWTVARKAPLSLGFSRQKYWSGLPYSPAGDLPDSGIEPVFLASPEKTGQASPAGGERTGLDVRGSA